ncbi:SDR family NAD(P)-dependent oxidoreductase [Pseudomonas sp. B392_1p]|uniref:SDR family NAD(P)-dependent oxidoreductase n=1 Tax=Pseudomonas sp. B392_1p TaxID=3457507 RepID=UPI003FD520F9
MRRFEEKVVVVIGSATGLGRAMAEGFAREGAQLVLADVDANKVKETLQHVESLGAQAIAIKTDVMKREDLVALTEGTLKHFGRVDIVCSNAGVGEYSCSAWEKSDNDLDWVMGVNLYGTAYAVSAFIPVMLKQGHGHFVATGSNTSLQPIPSMAVYAASKRAMLGYCETLQYDLWNAESEVKVSVICPNKVITDMPDSARNRPQNLAGRTPTAEEVARKTAFLAAGGHTPDEAAEIVLDGVAEQRFYILTNSVDADQAQAWAAGVRDGQLVRPNFAPPKLGR